MVVKVCNVKFFIFYFWCLFILIGCSSTEQEHLDAVFLEYFSTKAPILIKTYSFDRESSSSDVEVNGSFKIDESGIEIIEEICLSNKKVDDERKQAINLKRQEMVRCHVDFEGNGFIILSLDPSLSALNYYFTD